MRVDFNLHNAILSPMRRVPTDYQRTISLVKIVFYAGSAFTLIAGAQLFLFAEQTETLFAWTIRPALTAAVLGAFYWGTMFFGFLSARETHWAYARIAALPVLFFTFLTMVATFIHFDRFHLNSSNWVTLGATWAWVGLYAIEPFALLVAYYLQSRAPGGDPPRTRPLPRWFRTLIGIEGALMLLVGVGLMIMPELLIPSWGWALTPLTARALAAWLVAVGLVGPGAIWENDWRRVRVAMPSYVVFAALNLIALARFAGDVRWDLPGLWAYLLLIPSLLFIGIYGILESHRGISA